MARREEEIEDFFSHFSPAPGSVGYVEKCWAFKGEKRINSLSFFLLNFMNYTKTMMYDRCMYDAKVLNFREGSF